MDTGAWWATVHGVTELDTTEVTYGSQVALVVKNLSANADDRDCWMASLTQWT